MPTKLMLFNLDTYNGLSDSQKQVIDEHCTPEWSERFSVGWAIYDEGVRQEMIDSPDHDVFMPTDDEIALWREASEATVTGALEAVDAAGYDSEAVFAGLKDALAANNSSY